MLKRLLLLGLSVGIAGAGFAANAYYHGPAPQPTVQANAEASRIESALHQHAEELRQQLPIQMDQTTKMVGITASGKSIIHDMALTKIIPVENIASVRNAMQRSTRQEACTSSKTRKFLDNGVIMVWDYHDPAGNGFPIRISFCATATAHITGYLREPRHAAELDREQPRIDGAPRLYPQGSVAMISHTSALRNAAPAKQEQDVVVVRSGYSAPVPIPVAPRSSWSVGSNRSNTAGGLASRCQTSTTDSFSPSECPRRGRSGRNAPAQNTPSVTPPLPLVNTRPMIDPRNGTVYAPSGPNYVNTRDGTLMVPAGPNGYINTRTGQFQHVVP